MKKIFILIPIVILLLAVTSCEEQTTDEEIQTQETVEKEVQLPVYKVESEGIYASDVYQNWYVTVSSDYDEEGLEAIIQKEFMPMSSEAKQIQIYFFVPNAPRIEKEYVTLPDKEYSIATYRIYDRDPEEIIRYR